MNDRPNTTPTGQDRKTPTFKAPLQQARLSEISPLCTKAGEGLYRSPSAEADPASNAIHSREWF